MTVWMMNEEHLQALTLHVLLGEISFQSQLAAKAAEHLPACGEQFDSVEVWSAIQSILIAAGNVSKILWPSPGRSARGEALRALLDVDDTNPLSNRKFRNHFEHYDERIEDWMATKPAATYLDQKIGPAEFDPHVFPQLVHRHYDPCTKALIFRNESMNLAFTLEALESIRRKCGTFVLAQVGCRTVNTRCD
jgi:hypothetical protein